MGHWAPQPPPWVLEPAASQAADSAAFEHPGGATHLLSSCWPPAEVRRLAEEGTSLLGSWDDIQSGDFSGVPTTHLVHFVLDHATRTARAAPFLAGAAQLDHPQVCPNPNPNPNPQPEP